MAAVVFCYIFAKDGKYYRAKGSTMEEAQKKLPEPHEEYNLSCKGSLADAQKYLLGIRPQQKIDCG